MPTTKSVTLHSAIDSYAEFVQRTFRPSRFQNTRRRLNTIKSRHSDLPLSNMTASFVTDVLQFWANRPVTPLGQRYKSTTALNFIREFRTFLRWLDLSDDFEWKMPIEIGKFQIRPVKLREDIESFRRRNETYTPQQLGIVYQSTTIVEEALLLLGINCAMSAAEIARLRRSDFIDGGSATESLPPECNAGESVVFVRKPKTGCERTILLWSETAEALRTVLRASQTSDCDHLFCSAIGTDKCHVNAGVPTQLIAQRWRRLVLKTQAAVPDLPSLPFGSLRKTTIKAIAEYARLHDTRDILGQSRSIVNHIIRPSSARLFRSIRELRSHFQPVFHSDKHSD